jgi:hypothetical protein
MLDDFTFRQLKESQYLHPEVTEIIYYSDKILEMCLIAIIVAILGFGIAWDKAWFNFIWKYCKEGTDLDEKQAKEITIVTIISILFGGNKFLMV